MRNFVLTSESVTVGHPDKLCDQISDAVVDACLASDPQGAINAECAAASGVIFLSLRHRRELAFDPAATARRVIDLAGYHNSDAPTRMTVMLDSVLNGEMAGPSSDPDRPAGHMTTVFGHACDHTPERIALPIWSAHRLTACLDGLRRDGSLAGLSPDAQVQVAVRFEERRPVAFDVIALTFSADTDDLSEAAVREVFVSDVVAPALGAAEAAPGPETRIVVTRRSERGGPRTHAGLTGRKTADDCYGSFSRHGSSALSGKDPARVDRIAAYAARHAALSVVEAGLARECEVQLSYVAGDSGPISVEVDTFGSGAKPDADILRIVGAAFDFRVGAIAERFGLWGLPAARDGRFYRDLATYGHFGRSDLDLPWETAAEI
ncbi:methionine adenosyltransferase domain-containing protein [Amorphus sp. 3PC139-8]|uniref:methionine adenosyltransferase domain-containing protein n=1 Tax=Amorphus sp. 3PC139-8 TaxID=2735676 RepID=UPI00345CCCF5